MCEIGKMTEMEQRQVAQNGEKSIYVEKNEGTIYVGNGYVDEPSSAFDYGSYELLGYSPTIEPAIRREEVGSIENWMEQKATNSNDRLALLYGKPGIGKSVVMHDLLEELQRREDYLVLGLKSDQVTFVDTDDLSRKIRLAKPIEVVISEMAQQYRRVVLLIDQIDALSLSLSSNRTPLRSLLMLISRIKNVPGTRVIISCRPYDLEYDPLLEDLRIKHKWELKKLPQEQVLKTLGENGCKEALSKRLLHFLGNPLHLYLFLKVRTRELMKATVLSTDLLYHQLWRKYVTDDSERKPNKDKLLALLDRLVTTMYERQELSVHIREFETEFSTELQYLFSNGLLLLTKNGQVQFFHQTLFDYVYARRFTEREFELLEMLRGRHQGLFSRAAVKSILTFLRELDPARYINTIEQLLYARNEDGSEVYRYHLKSLSLSNMAYFETPLKEELGLIERRIFGDRTYMNVVFETVYAPHWFNAIWDIIDRKGGWKSLPKEYRAKAMLMCQRSLWPNAEIVLDRVEKELDYSDEEDCKEISNLLEHYELNCSSDRLIAYYQKLVKSRLPLEHIHLLNNILKENPDFVTEELRENIRLQLQEKDQKYGHRITITHDVETLYEELLKNYREKGVRLLVDILSMAYEASKFLLDGAEIYNSMEFFGFQRTTGGHFYSNFIEDSANILIDDFLKTIDGEQTRNYLTEFAHSEHEGFVFIALYVYTAKPELFKDDIQNLIITRSVIANAPSWVEYQALEALKVAWPLWTEGQKKNIVERILAIDDKGERILFKDFIEMRLKYGHPLLDVDLHKGKALCSIPIYELRELSWDAYQNRLRIERKFNPTRLVNDVPSKTSSHTGWSSLPLEKGLKMSCKTWHKAMLTYTINPLGWEKPSLIGQCHLFRNVVGQQPDRFIGFINEVIADDRVLLAYPLAGMQGLLDAGRRDEAMHVLQGILEVAGYDVNSDKRGFDLHSLLFALNDIVKADGIPEIVFELFCNALLNAKEPEEDRHKDEKDVYTIGMNQSRGNAGYMLVECAREEKYKERIFATIEQIASTASVYTRAAILLNMAALNYLDKQRNVELFKMLMHDYDPRLMALPVHNYNPLAYFINYAVDELMEFFSHAVDCEDCYREQVVILWLAWSHNYRDEHIKEFLDKMCDNSQEARISLLHFLCTLDEKMNDDAIVYMLRFLEPQFDSAEMGDACDNMFHHASDWTDGVQAKVAEAYVNSPLSKHKIRVFIDFLAGYAIKDPIQTLDWLERVLITEIVDDFYVWNHIVDVIIQSYNGIKNFNDSSYQATLEHAMDLIDTVMQNPSNKYLISNFINKLDNE